MRKLERSTAEDISDISSRLDNIEICVADIHEEVKKLQEPLVRSDGVHQSIPDGIDNLSGHLWQMRLEIPAFKRIFETVLWMLVLVAVLLALVLWRIW